MSEQPNFDDHDAYLAWNEHAHSWASFVESGEDIYREVHGSSLMAQCEPVAQLDVLDLGCGQGYFSRLLAQQGAHVAGIDLSHRLIERAVEHEMKHAQGIRYQTLSATQACTQWAPESFGLIVGCMSFHNFSNVFATMQCAHQLLRPSGRLVFSIPHPCTNTLERNWIRDPNGQPVALQISRYFDSGPHARAWNIGGQKWQAPQWRLTLEDWSDLIGNSGFLIRRQSEPRPTQAQLTIQPQLLGCSLMPYFLIYVLVKAAPGTGAQSEGVRRTDLDQESEKPLISPM